MNKELLRAANQAEGFSTTTTNALGVRKQSHEVRTLHTFYQDLFLKDLRDEIGKAKEEAGTEKDARRESETQNELLRKQVRELRGSVHRYRERVAKMHGERRRDGSMLSDSEGSESLGDKQLMQMR